MALSASNRLVFAGAAWALAACGSEAVGPADPLDLPEGPCGRGVVVVSTDYASTSVAVLDWEGVVRAPTILSSGSELPGLSSALSGDVVAPSERSRNARIVLVDRYPASTITWLDPTSPDRPEQLSVQTGFASNPQDAIDLDDGRALVARYEANLDAGREPFDEGSDLLVVDRAGPSIVGRVDLTDAMRDAPDGILPRPARLRRAGDRVVALLAAYSANFAKSADTRLAFVDPTTDSIAEVVVLEGLRGCAGIDVAPSGERVLVACSGTFGGTSTPTTTDAGLVVIDRAIDGSWTETKRLPASALSDDPLGFSCAFTSETTALATTFGRLEGGARPDRLLAIDLTSGEARSVLESEPEAFTLGEVRCGLSCGTCFVADAGRSVVHRLRIDRGSIAERREIAIDDGIGLPPRYLGAY